MKRLVFVSILLVLILAACASPDTLATDLPPVTAPPATLPAGPFTLTSPAFPSEGEMPVRYGEIPFNVEVQTGMTFLCPNSTASTNNSPVLNWSNQPSATVSLALVMVDKMDYVYPDASPDSVFTHWVVMNIPPTTTALLENFSADDPATSGIIQGANDYPPPYDQGYGGPCPGGETHLFIFTLYALDLDLDLPQGTTRTELLTAIQGHILAQTELQAYFTGE